MKRAWTLKMNRSAQWLTLMVAGLWLSGCDDGAQSEASEPDAALDPGAGGGFEGGAGGAAQGGLEDLYEVDPASAEAGRVHLQTGDLSRPLLPELAFRHIYITWHSNPARWVPWFQDEEAFWPAFRARYGIQPPIEGTDDVGLGVHRTGEGMVTFGCSLCHATTVAGTPTWGVNNHELKLAKLKEDLEAMPGVIERARRLPLPGSARALLDQIPDVDLPWLSGAHWRTGGPGLNDSMGLAVSLAGGDDDLVEGWGVQAAPAWWTTRYRTRHYRDGSGDANSYRPMMSMHLGFGITPVEAISLLDEFSDIQSAIRSLPIPRWADYGLPEPDPDQVAAGRAIYQANCAECHGVYEGPEAHYPEVITPVEAVGTDPLRAEAMTEEAATFFNDAIVQEAFEPTGGYLAPPLSGIFARAPYLHNGSVPTLYALLRPEARPTVWAPTGHTFDGYDPEAVGWRVEVFEEAEAAGRYGAVDGAAEGTLNTGHTYGADLPEAEMLALIEYLKTL